MAKFDNFSLKVKHLKCFGEEEQGFDEIKPINLIIGRNNSGKSTLLDLIEYAVGGNIDSAQSLRHDKYPPEVIAEAPLTETELRPVFQESHAGGDIGGNHWEFGKQFIGTRLRWNLCAQNNQRFISIGDCLNGHSPLAGMRNAKQYLARVSNAKENPFHGKVYRRISAERNIIPEGDNSKLEVGGDGKGITNIIQNFINKANLASDLVEEVLLNELNVVFKADAMFTDIVCQQLESGQWEIYLKEESKGLIALSQSGSGLKTIILVLVYIYLVPVVLKKNLSEFVFGFEELENNLHPALLRRLLSYLHKQAKDHGCMFFLTTHSNVDIDFFNKNDDAQILHVTHDGKQAYCRMVRTYIDNKGILDDLDVRASDLLQANGVIWVEGPSDRIYLNRWIDLWSGGELIEGNHYQCVFYGGRLLSHLSSEEPELVEDAVPILSVNRNSVIMIDSDKLAHQTPLGGTKERIISEIGNNDGLAWVTKGKEIENYISGSVVSKWLGKEKIKQVTRYEDFFDYLDGIEAGKGKSYSRRKPLLAEQLSPHMTKENIDGVLDLGERLEQLCDEIKKWNSL
jgi:hypothetical protein